ncbi:undecaprenyl-diphosphate phosphatase [Sphingomonas sp. ACRSK]|uniref:undecaprenyl-diphosphate phosphatase n=1 Tax=Sphingomonas sp. ACRSK TaxID=2918213 RepID=UPI001EF508A1|nr:undecaprenyl-diphosphate phosphatase [Sphingomonas sp. ACRSK]MCG7349589.1 undecaprenyl-diphosphate phosphatase [Sphingomonas sp. ACRSK]
MTDLLTIILLGIVEGVTEFLPVSSTGHLILAGALLGFKGEASGTFEIVIQLGAILSVIVLYWRRFWDVFVGLGRRDPRAIAFTRNVALAFLPSAVIGLIVYKMVKAMLESPMTVAVALVVGGIAILVIERLVRAPKVTNVEQMSWKVALGIGIIQCLAMIPGVSRSGATIMGALGLGVDRKTAAEFSFFLAVPTMLAASAYDLYKNAESIGSDGWLAIAIGFVVSFVVALLVIRWFLGIVTRHGFTPFAWYRIVAGGVAIVWLSQL